MENISMTSFLIWYGNELASFIFLSKTTKYYFSKNGQSRPLFVYFRPFLIIISIMQIEKSIYGVLGFELAAAIQQAQTKPRSYGGRPKILLLFGPHLMCELSAFSSLSSERVEPHLATWARPLDAKPPYSQTLKIFNHLMSFVYQDVSEMYSLQCL